MVLKPKGRKKRQNNMLKKTILILTLFLLNISISYAEDLKAKIIELQGDNIKMQAELMIERNNAETYEKLYKGKKFWNEIKEYVIIGTLVYGIFR